MEGILGYEPNDPLYHYATSKTAKKIRSFWARHRIEDYENLPFDTELDGILETKCGAYRREGSILLWPALEGNQGKICPRCLELGAVYR